MNMLLQILMQGHHDLNISREVNHILQYFILLYSLIVFFILFCLLKTRILCNWLHSVFSQKNASFHHVIDYTDDVIDCIIIKINF